MCGSFEPESNDAEHRYYYNSPLMVFPSRYFEQWAQSVQPGACAPGWPTVMDEKLPTPEFTEAPVQAAHRNGFTLSTTVSPVSPSIQDQRSPIALDANDQMGDAAGGKAHQTLPKFSEVFGPRQQLPAKPVSTYIELLKPLPAKFVSDPISPGGANASPKKRKADTVCDENVRPPTPRILDDSSASLPGDHEHDRVKLPSSGGPKGTPTPKKRVSVAPCNDAVPPPIPRILNVFSVSLPDDYDHTKLLYPVYDTCDEIRRKLRAVLRRKEVTRRQLVLALCKTRNGSLCEGGYCLTTSQLYRFLAMDGALVGRSCHLYYAGYLFFEKMRIRDRQPKSAERLRMEIEHPQGLMVLECREVR